MGIFDNQIMMMFSWDVIRQLSNNEQISVYKFNILTTMLMSHGIPFDVAFASGTRKESPALELTIHINPSTTLVFVVALEPGSTVFNPSP